MPFQTVQAVQSMQEGRQRLCLGCGFIKAFTTKILLGKGRNIEEEVAIRKGK